MWIITILLTSLYLLGALWFLILGLVGLSRDEPSISDHSIIAGLLCALVAAILLPAGLLYVFNAWELGRQSPMAFSVPDPEFYWYEFKPAIIDLETRTRFGAQYPNGLTGLNVLAAIFGLITFLKLTRLPFQALLGIPRTRGFFKHFLGLLGRTAKYYALTLLWAGVFYLFWQTVFLMAAYALATALGILFILFVLVFIAGAISAMGSRVTVTDSSGRTIGYVNKRDLD